MARATEIAANPAEVAALERDRDAWEQTAKNHGYELREWLIEYAARMRDPDDKMDASGRTRVDVWNDAWEMAAEWRRVDARPIALATPAAPTNTPDFCGCESAAPPVEKTCETCVHNSLDHDVPCGVCHLMDRYFPKPPFDDRSCATCGVTASNCDTYCSEEHQQWQPKPPAEAGPYDGCVCGCAPCLCTATERVRAKRIRDLEAALKSDRIADALERIAAALERGK
jgi:hypothetical protein